MRISYRCRPPVAPNNGNNSGLYRSPRDTLAYWARTIRGLTILKA
jgi:hypothetical protein